MIYIICVSGFHRALAKEIEKKQKQPCIIISLDKKRDVKGKVLNIIKALPLLAKCLFDKDSHAVIPHPFNPWFSLFTLASRKQSIFDDGIAYYYNAKIPNNLFCKIYLIISRKLNRSIKASSLKDATFRQYLESCSATNYYCIYPKTASINKVNTINVRPSEAKNKLQGNYIIFLDTHKDVAKRINEDDIVSFLQKLSNSESLQKIYFKPHPRCPSPISEKLRLKPWAQELQVDYESFLDDHKIRQLYSIYSSATLTTKIIQPDSKLYCFTNDCLQSAIGQIHELFEQENVSFIRFK